MNFPIRGRDHSVHRAYFVYGLFVMALALAAALAPAAITFDSTFECGNATTFTLVAPGEYSFANDLDTSSTDRQWFYFTVSGAKGQRLTFHLLEIDKTNVPGCWPTAHPVASSDGGETWRPIDGPNSSARRVFTFSHTPQSDTEHIAFHHPYSFARAQKMIANWSAHPDVQSDIIGHSIQGRPLTRLRITSAAAPAEGKRGAWIVTRQHAGEVTGSWVGEGFMEFLLSDDPKAKALREKFIINVVPMCNPDGVVAGNYRDNFAGANLNREWDNPSAESSPEILAVTRAIRQWTEEKNPYHFFADLHSTSGPSPHFAFHAGEEIKPPLARDPEIYHEESEKFLAIISAHNPAFDDKRGRSRSRNKGLGRENNTFNYGVLAFTFEAGYNRINAGPDKDRLMTPAVHKSIGESLARALHDYYLKAE